MLDRNNKSIENRGWEQMHSILDKEMPSEKRKRRFGFWFSFGGSALLILGMISLFYLNGNQNDSTLSFSETNLETNLEESPTENKLADKISIHDEVNKETIAPKSQSVSNENIDQKSAYTDVQAHSNTTQSGNTINNKTNPVRLPETTVIQEQVSKSTISSSKTNAIAKASRVDHSFELTTDRNKIEILESLKDSPSTIHIPKTTTGEIKDQSLESQILNSNKLGPSSDIISERSILDVLSPLPFIPQEEIKKANDFALHTQPLIAYSSNTNAYTPYLLAGISYQPNVKGFGYGFGAGLNYGNSNFSGYIEAEYIRTKYNVGKLSNNFADNADLTEITTISNDGDGSFVFQENEITSNPEYDLIVSNFVDLTTSMKEIRLSFGLRKKIFKGFSVNGGIAYARLLGVANKNLLVTPSVLNTALDQTEGSFNIKSSELYSSGVYSKQEIIPHLGIGYAFGDHIQLGLTYHYGFKNLIQRTDVERLNSISAMDDEIYRRNLSARIRYSF